MAFTASTLTSPHNLYTLSLTESGEETVPRQLTHETVGVTLPPVRDTVLVYPVAPGFIATARLVRPAGATTPVPTIVNAYPGSSIASYGAQRLGWGHYYMDVFGAIARGYAVLTVDIPMMPVGTYGERGPAADIVSGMTAALHAAAKTGWVDTTRLGVHGHSYGGYMVNVLVTRTKRFHAAVSLSGSAILNRGFWGGGSYADWSQHHQGRMEASLFDAPQRYVENSPLAWADSADTPLLLMHGGKDPHPLALHSEMLFLALAARDKPVEFVRFHEAAHHEYLDTAWQLALDWFDTHLKSQDRTDEPYH